MTAATRLVPSGFVVLRTPVLPFEAVLAGPEEQATGRFALSPESLDALYLASPSLVEQLIRADPASARGRAVERTLFRYFTRMASRSTPFGLLAGFLVGTVGTRNRLVVSADGARRHRQVGVTLLETMLRGLGSSPRFRRVIPFRVNPGLYRAGDRLHCPQGLASNSGFDGTVLSIEPVEPLDRLLAAGEPATADEWAKRLRRLAPATRQPNARRAIAELLDAGILVPALTTPVTALDPFRQTSGELERASATRSLAARLQAVAAELERVDMRRTPVRPATYRRLAKGLARLPGASETTGVFQADLTVGGEVSLGRSVVAEVSRAIGWLYRWVGAGPRREPLDRFRRSFRARYGDRPVPLLEALDEEIGIGLEMDDRCPVLNGPADPRYRVVLERLTSVWRTGDSVLIMRPEDLDQLGGRDDVPPLPGALAAVGSLAAVSTDAIDRGDYQFRLRAVRGPSGAELLGRLAGVDARLAESVRRHLRAEEALDPEAIYAEVVHVPSPALAPIQCRPQLRRYEIVALGRPGVSPRRQLPLTDLLVSVPEPGNRVVLWSARLGRRIQPRLTTAHDFTRDGYLPYRFLGLVQRDNVAAVLEWDWGSLEAAPFLPRVVLGKVVLARARWLLPGTVATAWRGTSGAEQLATIRRWRAEWSVPRFVVLMDPEGDLAVDLDQPASLQSLIDSAGRKDGGGDTAVEELFPGPEAMPVAGPAGRFAHDLVIPFIQRAAPPSGRVRRKLPRRAARPVRRTLVPGSECLYLKLYGGTAAADRVLVEGIGPLVERLAQAGVIERWFFIRYRDSEPHLRVRLIGPPQRLVGEALPHLRTLADSLLERGVIWRMTFDTYEREVERFGGPEGMDLAERVFHADSIAVLRLLSNEADGLDPDARLAHAVLGVDRLLQDFVVPVRARLGLITGMIKRAADREIEGSWEREAGERFRTGRQLLEAGSAAYRDRSRALRPIALRIRSIHASDGQSGGPEKLLADLAHLHCNRMLRSAATGEEAIVLRWLAKLYRSRVARRSKNP